MKTGIYVGTYAKYNSGSIQGAWIDPSEHADHETFIAACLALHSDESDPELMYQDYEGFPEQYYSESGIDADLWDWLALDESDRALLAAYIDATGDNNADIETARDSLYGRYDSDLDMAYDYIESTGLLSDVHESIARYFDYEAFARDLSYDFSQSNGYYFSN